MVIGVVVMVAVAAIDYRRLPGLGRRSSTG